MAKAPASDFRLAVDVGNTQTVLGLFEGSKILRRWRVATRKDVTVDEIVLWLRGLAGSHAERMSATAIASVVPNQDAPWTAALEEVFRREPQVLGYRNCLGLKLDYEIPSQIGADRLANVLGAKALGIAEGVVLDFGTATTFDVFTANTYHGGVICPGIQSGMRILAQSAAKLAEAELRWPETAVGRNTDDALRIGILRGSVGLVEGLLKDILRERPMRKPVILATGGLAHWMKGHAPALKRFEPDLTLIGINHLLSAAPAARTARKRKQP